MVSESNVWMMTVNKYILQSGSLPRTDGSAEPGLFN